MSPAGQRIRDDVPVRVFKSWADRTSLASRRDYWLVVRGVTAILMWR